ncbi:NAD(P)-dependent oxidoreductase [Paracoccus xiamenensis]|uniref:NAD(P)-dependent oxidoreductase n=1 Tax=Paracoccus xiamenensis TaxID=2714901 RepID=UPI001408D88D|nr:NAD(P)-dependent oxidoreductase [Paracoccus xiamenensis]NHF73306.1 NAD(P)-dependent oxidoreductase [Paracoccus xiamenensis]
MTNSPLTPGLAAARLPADTILAGFANYDPALQPHEAAVAADRCYFCYDAPCVTACPTGIDIPLFIRQIATGTPEAAAETILSSNILGGMCARVCPTETLCEGACVRETAEGKPVEIGRLQRYATDVAMQAPQPFARAAATGKRVAVVGAGPAGLAAAHRLAMLGHDVTIIEARPKPGGLNEFGIAAYKATEQFAAREIDWLLGIGGITLECGKALGRNVTLTDLRDSFDAVFLGIGLGGVNDAGLGPANGVLRDAVDFIAELRQTTDLASLPVGRDVVVIGGGMTAVDAAVQSRLLGAENVTIVYRRGQDRMSASGYEQVHATASGVRIRTNAAPVALHKNGSAAEIEFAYTEDGPAGLQHLAETFRLRADQVLSAIGQRLAVMPDGLVVAGGKLAVTGPGRSALPGVWAGGDCTEAGEDLTVSAVAQGRDAAEDMHIYLMGGENG